MLNLPEIMPIDTVLAMAKIPFETVKQAETSHLIQNKPAGSAFSKIQRRLRRANPNASSPRNNQTTQDEPSGIKIRLKNWRVDPANVKVIISDDGHAEQPCREPNLFKDACKETFDTVKTAESSQPHTNSADSAFSQIRRRLRRAKPNTSSSLRNKQTTQDEPSGIKIRMKDLKFGAANVKPIISDGGAEQPCSEPNLSIKDACKETPYPSDQKLKPESNLTAELQRAVKQRKVGCRAQHNVTKPIIF